MESGVHTVHAARAPRQRAAPDDLVSFAGARPIADDIALVAAELRG